MKNPLTSSLSIIAISLSVYAAYALMKPTISDAMTDSSTQAQHGLETATFAGGCFWCMEYPFEELDGVVAVVSGYSGGHKENPTYKEVSAGTTGHAEVVRISYDPKKVSYKKLLDVFWHQIDPTDPGGSFVDRGSQYRSAIFYHNDKQQQLAQQSKMELGNSGTYDKPIVTEIVAATKFYEAEAYHQDYYKENPVRYKFYRYRSGRDQYLEKTWGTASQGGTMQKMSKIDKQQTSSYKKPSDEILQQRLTPLQYEVTQKDGTERPFNNKYWDNKKPGIYVDIVSGEPLFSSIDKYDSGTGWPSFSKPISGDALTEKSDRSLFTTRIEIRSKLADSHLGHVFNDGPAPTGKRYCMNSAALRFIPIDKLDTENYGQYAKLFK